MALVPAALLGSRQELCWRARATGRGLLGKPGVTHVRLSLSVYRAAYATWRVRIFISVSVNKKVEEQSFRISRSPVFTRGREEIIYVQPSSTWLICFMSCSELRSVFYFMSHQVTSQLSRFSRCRSFSLLRDCEWVGPGLGARGLSGRAVCAWDSLERQMGCPDTDIPTTKVFLFPAIPLCAN